MPSTESLALNDLLGKLVKDFDVPNTVSCAVKDFAMQLKVEAQNKTEVGKLVLKILEAAENKSDPLFDGMDMLERMQIMQGAHTARKMCE